LAEVSIDNKMVAIPLHQDLIAKVDNKKKEILMVLPEGILEVNE